MFERPTGAPETPSADSRQKSWLPPGFDTKALAGSYSKNYYVPNSFPLFARVFNAFVAAVLLLYGAHGIYMDDLYIPPGRGGGSGTHLHGVAAWLLYGAMVAAASSLLALVVDHYDRRNNEQHYMWFRRAASLLGYCLFAASVFWS